MWSNFNSHYGVPFCYFEIHGILVQLLLVPTAVLLLFVALGAVCPQLGCPVNRGYLLYVLISVKVETDFCWLARSELHNNTFEVSPRLIDACPNVHQLQ